MEFIGVKKITVMFFISLIGIPIIFLFLSRLGYSINDQAYFYTLSTISQTLGAILGISVIFLTFNLQNLESRKYEYINQLMELIPIDDGDCIVLFTTFEGLNDDELLECLNKINIRRIRDNNEKDVYSKIINVINNLKSNIYKRQNSKQFFPYFTFPASITIILSIIFLPFGNIIFPEKNIIFIPSIITIGIVVGLAVASLFAIIYSFYELVVDDSL